MLIDKSIKKFLNDQFSLKLRERLFFFQQFSTLIEAGLTIIPSIEMLARNQKNHQFCDVIYNIKHHLMAGKSLSFSMGLHPQYFDNLICELIHIGEHTGKLDCMLRQITIHNEKQFLLQNKIKKILFYPTIVLVSALLISLGLFIFIVPRFVELFQGFQLPWLTRAMFHLSYLLINHFVLLTLGFILLASVSFCFWKSILLRKRLYFIIQRLPIVKNELKHVQLARFSNHVAIMLSAGITLMDALSILIKAGDDFLLTPILFQLSTKLNAGLSLHDAMLAVNYFPDLMIQLIKVGESSGKLDLMFQKIALILEDEMDRSLYFYTQLLEPLIMAILGVLIGGLVIGMYLPIFKIGSTL